MSCSKTQHSGDFEARNRGLESSTLPLSHCTLEMLCSPEQSKPLKPECSIEPHLDFAFMHKSFATGASSFTRVNSNVSCFAVNVYKKWPTF